MSFYPELDHLNLEELIARFQHSPPQGEEDASVYYPEVALLISQQGKDGIAFLWKEIEGADTETERLRAILFGLTEACVENQAPVEENNRILLHDRLISYLQDEQPLVVAEAVDGLRRLNAKIL